MLFEGTHHRFKVVGMLEKSTAAPKSKTNRSDIDRGRLYGEIKASGLFDGNFYLETNPDVALANLDPLDHYIRCGWREGRKPSKVFDALAYLKANPDLKDTDDPFLHYLREGRLPDVPVH